MPLPKSPRSAHLGDDEDIKSNSFVLIERYFNKRQRNNDMTKENRGDEQHFQSVTHAKYS